MATKIPCLTFLSPYLSPWSSVEHSSLSLLQFLSPAAHLSSLPEGAIILHLEVRNSKRACAHHMLHINVYTIAKVLMKFPIPFLLLYYLTRGEGQLLCKYVCQSML